MTNCHQKLREAIRGPSGAPCDGVGDHLVQRVEIVEIDVPGQIWMRRKRRSAHVSGGQTVFVKYRTAHVPEIAMRANKTGIADQIPWVPAFAGMTDWVPRHVVTGWVPRRVLR